MLTEQDLFNQELMREIIEEEFNEKVKRLECKVVMPVYKLRGSRWYRATVIRKGGRRERWYYNRRWKRA